ncbi:MAG: hypothetical protein LBP72_01980 [Dysgonamonadaceae bacterium]|jgi:hypothetical protein|nr:hypothetical protein [Dysgonamonadaceae bacterium]
MNKKLNDLLNVEILKKVPKNLKPIEYLVDMLSISKESAYRRMRGEIPFSFDEISSLSLDLDFSVDEIIGNKKEDRIFFDAISKPEGRVEESFLAILRDYYKLTESVCKATQKDMILSINRLIPCLLLKYDSLFKLLYYQWIHQTSTIRINHPFSEIVIPTEISELRKKYKKLVQPMRSANIIVDKNIFLSTIREIQYYYGRKLISENELLTLKQDLIKLLFDIEFLMQKGCNESGCEYNFYLSMLNIESNTAWISFDSNIISRFWLYPVNPIIISNPKTSNAHKKWLESLKKYSILITQSNEILQTKFIDKQREYIENITNDLIFYE